MIWQVKQIKPWQQLFFSLGEFPNMGIELKLRIQNDTHVTRFLHLLDFILIIIYYKIIQHL